MAVDVANFIANRFVAPDRAEIDRTKYGNALMRNEVARIPQTNQAQDLAIQTRQQALTDTQKENARGVLARSLSAIAQSPQPKIAAQQLISSPDFRAAGTMLGLPVDQFTVTAQDTDEVIRSGAMDWARALGTQGQPNLIGTVNPSDFTPESLAAYKTSGNPADLKRISGDLFGRYNPRDYTPESLARFKQTGDPGDLQRIANYQAQQMPGGGLGAFNPVSGRIDATPVSDQQAQQQAAALARSKAEAAAIGEATGKAQGAILTKALNAENIGAILDIADPLIDEATGSGSGAGRDALAAFFGVSTTGAQAIAQLKPLQAAIMLNQPRMEGPQSDRDVQLYREAAGQIGDPSVPRETKKAALQTIRRLQQVYASRAPGSQATGGWSIRRLN